MDRSGPHEPSALRRDRPSGYFATFRDVSQIIELQTIDVPHGFDTVVTVGIDVGTAPDNLTGFITAFGGHRHRCFAYVFRTVAEGPGCDAVVGERLGTMVERSLLRTKLRDTIVPQMPMTK